MSDRPAHLRMEAIDKSFPGVHALKGVDEVTASNIEISHPALDKFGGLIITTIEVVKKDGAIIGLNGAALLGDEKIVIKANQLQGGADPRREGVVFGGD